jgi:hypothetical protein
VHIKKATESENGYTLNNLLGWITKVGDGRMEEAQTLRDTYGADMVVIVGSSDAANGVCGWGWVPQTFDSNSQSYGAYSAECLPSGRLWAHEIGHTMGCHHDRINDLQSDSRFIAYGHCWEDAAKTDCTCYKSTLVYECDTPRYGCTSCKGGKLYYANPNVRESGSPTGTANAACGLHIHQNRNSYIKYGKSIQPGGMLFSVTPSSAVFSTCSMVNVTGWQLLRDMNDKPVVTINGVQATVLSFNINSVQVKTSAVSSPSSVAGSVVVTASQSGRVTTLPNVFTHLPSDVVYNETFSAGTLVGTRWSSVGVAPWVVKSKANVLADGNGFPSGSSAILQFTVSSSSPQTGSCVEVVTSLSFSYWAYSPYDYCYGPFTVQVQTFGSTTWTTLKTLQGKSDEGATPFIAVSVVIPTNVKFIRLKADSAAITGCSSQSPVQVRSLTVRSTYTCNSGIACGNTASHIPTASPTFSSTKKPSAKPSSASRLPTLKPSSRLPTLTPSTSSTRTPTTKSSVTPSVKPTSRAPTIKPGNVPSSVNPTAKTSAVPSMCALYCSASYLPTA